MVPFCELVRSSQTSIDRNVSGSPRCCLRCSYAKRRATNSDGREVPNADIGSFRRWRR